MFIFAKTISISFADYMAFNKMHFGKWKLRPVWVWAFVTVLSVLFYTIGYNTDSRIDESSTPFLVFLFFFIYAIIAAGTWLLVLLTRLRFRLIHFIAYKLNPHTFVHIEVLINEKGIEYKTTKRNFIALWSQIIETREDSQRYFIYYARNAVFILPKRYLDSLEERTKFVNFLKAFSNPDLKLMNS
ncbi:YcxB family protein [Dysgonomonas sp. 521]|uniref:YcxB family protein n=1 Tax=Dysgonomonas sp. 521 TaxID=2302932 RepID=UPI0013D47347|nr:YcxB family protein [Dysgonomonas sp. 521]NDV94467.1 YcxB family protein [Dysgonomonas sp. 521]